MIRKPSDSDRTVFSMPSPHAQPAAPACETSDRSRFCISSHGLCGKNPYICNMRPPRTPEHGRRRNRPPLPESERTGRRPIPAVASVGHETKVVQGQRFRHRSALHRTRRHRGVTNATRQHPGLRAMPASERIAERNGARAPRTAGRRLVARKLLRKGSASKDFGL